MGRPYKTEAVILSSIRYAEADRILHLYTADRGRIGAIAKGVRKTTSRFGGRLEPLGHVELMLHQGSGELQTITGVSLVRSHHETRENGYRLAVGLIGAEAMLRLFTEQEGNERAFTALTRFLDLLDDTPPGGRANLDPLPGPAAEAAGSGHLLHVGLRSAGRTPDRSRPARAGGTVCQACSAAHSRLTGGARRGWMPLRSPLADAPVVGLTERGARDVPAVITASYEERGFGSAR